MFKVGDKVRLITNDAYNGNTGTIEDIKKTKPTWYNIKVEETFDWNDFLETEIRHLTPLEKLL